MKLEKRIVISLLVVGILAVSDCRAQQDQGTLGNRAQRLEWFRDMGFGLFIHWSVDSQLGSVISHSMVAADDAYLKRYIEELPKTFNPHKFNPDDWASLAKLAGIKYVVFTTKHHNGFCMFDTRTTDFSIMNTPFKRDITAEIIQAFRKQGIAPGVYFSPDDFWWLYKKGITIQRRSEDVLLKNNPGLLAYDQAQVRELLKNYGPIDIIFFDGEAEDLRDVAWQAQPDIVVTRGAMKTPEQYIPGVPLDGAWEACLTMGTQWQYKPTNESYKSGGYLISLLIETRAKGGNLLLNVGPKPDGELPIEQEERLREVALWMFVNSECIYGVRPWTVTNEGDIWFTKKKDEDTVYAVVKQNPVWKFGQWRDIVLKSVEATKDTQISVLGQNDKVLEYQLDVKPKTTWQQQGDGLHIRAMRSQRLYNDFKWPNPVVLKITHAKPALVPPKVVTVKGSWDAQTKTAMFEGKVLDMGKTGSLEAGFEYRDITGQDLNERTASWIATPFKRMDKPGSFSDQVTGLIPGNQYEFRTVVGHPLLKVYGDEMKLNAKF
jgi:alpha-L-fucosidase